MRCCPNCFADSFLRRQIRAESRQRGSCGFCDSRDVEIIDASLLADLFAPVLDFYFVEDSGVDLATRIQSDWGTFGRLDVTRIVALLSSITGDRAVGSAKYKCKIEQDADKLEQWYAFREELKHENRYFPTLIPDQEHLRNLFELLSLPIDEVPGVLYRARINVASTPYSAHEMGMPPKAVVSNGRANPKGIPYLYAASDVRTAIAEIRPFISDSVTVVELEVMDPIALVDLRNPKHSISPFELAEDDLSDIYRDMPFLILLGDELSKPIVPRVADLEYLPSQYLCEFVKHIGFEGIVYRSSLAEGDNYAIFRDSKLNPSNPTLYKIDSLDVSYSQLQ